MKHEAILKKLGELHVEKISELADEIQAETLNRESRHLTFCNLPDVVLAGATDVAIGYSGELRLVFPMTKELMKDMHKAMFDAEWKRPNSSIVDYGSMKSNFRLGDNNVMLIFEQDDASKCHVVEAGKRKSEWTTTDYKVVCEA